LAQRNASRPWSQFEAQVEDVAEQIRRAEHNTREKFVDAALYDQRARETVMEDWKRQGIYDRIGL
jgi:hypothetical protein